MTTLADSCTGEDIVAAIGAEAARRGTTAHAMVRALSPDPAKWMSQVIVARRPKRQTVERVRALLAGEVVAEAPARPKTPRSMVRKAARPAPARSAEKAPTSPPADRVTALRSEIFAEAASDGFRRWVAQSTGSVARPLPASRPTPIEQFVVAGVDRRPFARGRNPCPCCNTRGDIGCRHQRPDPELPPLQGLDPP